MPAKRNVLETIPRVDRAVMPKYAAHRREMNKDISREAWTDRIKGSNILTRIALVEKTLLRNQKPTGRPLDGVDIRRLGLLADIQFKKLAKILPDLHRTEGTVTHQVIDRETLIAEAQALGLPLEFVFGERGITIEHGPTQESS